jgi:energy-coupling factor transporter ATP-binding protein EcfA2
MGAVKMAIVEFKDYSFEYALSDSPALSNLDFEIENGEFVLLLGPSGSGKSTLLRRLKPELAPAGKTRGTVSYMGLPLPELKKSQSAEIGLVLQNPDSQIVTETVWHELAFGLENLGLETGEIRRRVAEMSSFFGIGSWFHKKTDTLSGGQKQLLTLASVLAMKPRLLLLDEPTSLLDPVAAREFMDMVRLLNRELGITVIMSEYRLEEVYSIADKVLVLDRGKAMHFCPPRALVSKLREAAEPKLLSFMPSAVKIFCAVEKDSKAPCPVSINEGKSWLEKKKLIRKETEPPAEKNQSGEPLIECRNISYRYSKELPDVLKGLSLKARPGELLCILGENGSGKTTLLGILSRLLTPQGGGVRLGGRKLSEFSERELYSNNIAILPQNPKALFLCDTVGEDLKYAAKKYNTSENTALPLGIEHLLGRHPYDLSGGEQQKVALAKILLSRPRVLLLDEATKGLDPLSKAELAGILTKLNRECKCIILATHDIEFAAQYADRCLLLFDGEAASEGSPREFFGGNFFYTTAAGRMARDTGSGAITCGDVIGLCQKELQ